MAITAALAGVLSTLGYSLSGVGVSELMNKFGMYAGSNWRDFIDKLQKVINDNIQLLSDFKTKSETEKANIVQSMLNGSGLGSRAASLKKQFDKWVAQDKTLTEEVKSKNAEAQRRLNYANDKYSAARTGVLGGVEALLEKPENGDIYAVNNPEQNVNGGLQGGQK